MKEHSSAQQRSTLFEEIQPNAEQHEELQQMKQEIASAVIDALKPQLEGVLAVVDAQKKEIDDLKGLIETERAERLSFEKEVKELRAQLKEATEEKSNDDQVVAKEEMQIRKDPEVLPLEEAQSAEYELPVSTGNEEVEEKSNEATPAASEQHEEQIESDSQNVESPVLNVDNQEQSSEEPQVSVTAEEKIEDTTAEQVGDVVEEESKDIEKPKMSLHEARHVMQLVSLLKKEGVDIDDPSQLKEVFSDSKQLERLRKELRGGGSGRRILSIAATVTSFGLNKKFTDRDNSTLSEAAITARKEQQERDQQVANFTDRGLRTYIQRSAKTMEYYNGVADEEREKYGELAYEAAYAYKGVDSNGQLAIEDVSAILPDGKKVGVTKDMIMGSLRFQTDPWNASAKAEYIKKQIDINEASEQIARLDAIRGTKLTTMGMGRYEDEVFKLHNSRKEQIEELGTQLREDNPGISDEELQAHADAYWMAQNIYDHKKTGDAMRDTLAGKTADWLRGGGDRSKATRRQVTLAAGFAAATAASVAVLPAVATFTSLGVLMGLKTSKEYLTHKHASVEKIDMQEAYTASKLGTDGEEGFNDLSSQLYNAKESGIESQQKKNRHDALTAVGAAGARLGFSAAAGAMVDAFEHIDEVVTPDTHATGNEHSVDHGHDGGADASSDSPEVSVETFETHEPGDPISYDPEKDVWGNTATGEPNPDKLADLNFNEPHDTSSPEALKESFSRQVYSNPEQLSTFLAEGGIFKDIHGNVIENPTADQVNELGNAMKENPELFGERYDELISKIKISGDVKSIDEPFSSAYMDKGTDIQYSHGVALGGHYVTVEVEGGDAFDLRTECGQPIHFDGQVPIQDVPTVVPPTERPPEVKTDSEKTDSEKTDSEKTSSEKTSSEKTDTEKTSSEKTDSEKTDPETTDEKKWDGGVDTAPGIDPSQNTYNPETDDTPDPAISGNGTESPSIGAEDAAPELPSQEVVIPAPNAGVNEAPQVTTPEAGANGSTGINEAPGAVAENQQGQVQQQAADSQASQMETQMSSEAAVNEAVKNEQSGLDPVTGRPLQP